MRCAGAMGFDATLRAAHDGCRLGNVQLLPVTQQKRLPLTRWQPLQLFLNYFNNLRLFKLIEGASARARGICDSKGLERIEIIVLFSCGKGGKQRNPQGPDFLPAIEVTYGVLQNPLKEHGQLRCRLGAIFFGQLEHGVLNDVESALGIPDGEQRLLVRAPFYAREKLG
jgi:hypothetical protein